MKPIFLELSGVCEATTLGATSIKKMVREGSFPKPREIGTRRVGWLVSEIEEWAVALPVADMLPPPSAGERRVS